MNYFWTSQKHIEKYQEKYAWIWFVTGLLCKIIVMNGLWLKMHLKTKEKRYFKVALKVLSVGYEKKFYDYQM